MKQATVAIVLGVAAFVTSVSSLAGDRHKEARHAGRVGSGMQEVANEATTGQEAYRWRYFRDARKARAVVISPGGDYFYSRGDGLTLVYKGSAA